MPPFVCAFYLEETIASFLNRILLSGETVQQLCAVYWDVRDSTRVTTVLDTYRYESTYRSTHDSSPVLPLESHYGVCGPWLAFQRLV